MVACMVLKDGQKPDTDISSLAINFSTKYFNAYVERVLALFRCESKAFSNVAFGLQMSISDSDDFATSIHRVEDVRN
jgi:hypothetical protein